MSTKVDRSRHKAIFENPSSIFENPSSIFEYPSSIFENYFSCNLHKHLNVDISVENNHIPLLIAMLSIKRTALNEVAASRRRVRMVKRKRGLEAAPLASCGVEERMKLLLLIHLTSAYSMEGVNFLGLGASIRKGNIHRDRSSILRWAHQLDDVMFRRQFRLCREDFLFVVNKISVALHVNRQQAINSSGSSIPVELMLMITLRILAGASYLDMIHYHVHVDSVNKIVNVIISISSTGIDDPELLIAC